MIKARKLFLLPALTAFLCILPFGFIIWFIIIGVWYIKNQQVIHNYFRGNNYNKDEYKNVEDLK